MSERQLVSETIISSRNILLGGGVNEHVLPALNEVLLNLDSISIPSSRKIVHLCVSEVIRQVKNSNFKSAGMILNLIHNLPTDTLKQQRWDIDYFLSIELPTFLDQFDEIESGRLISLYVCNQLAQEYLPSNI
jgi:hypothetical protein